MLDKFRPKLNYHHQDTVRMYSEKGTFTAVRLLDYAIQVAANGGDLNFSNQWLLDVLKVSASTLHYAFNVLEYQGILTRQWKDKSIYQRDSFKLDYKTALEWLKITIYDKSYTQAPKRSFMRAFIKQSLLYVRNDKERIEDALSEAKVSEAKLKGVARKKLVDEIKNKINKDYERYIKFKTNQVNKIVERLNSTSSELEVYDDAIYSFSVSIGYRPPDLVQS